MTRDGKARGALRTREACAAFFDGIARRYDRVYAPPRDASRARLARVLAELPAAPAAVLDLGVGTGRELSALQDAGYAPVGMDLSPAMLALCARRARPVPLVEGDLWDPLPFADGAFHAVLALHGTLSHPPDDDALPRFSREIARVLTPGGVLVAEVPAPAWVEAVGAGALGHAGDTRAERVGDGRVVHRDDVAGVAIEAIVQSAEAWRAALSPALEARVDPLGPFELLVVGRAPRLP